MAAVTAVTAPLVFWQSLDRPAPPVVEVAEDPAGDTLVPPSYALPEFPFTPGRVPDGLGEGRYSYSTEYLELRHEDPARPAFTFDLLPPGAELTSMDRSTMSFAPAGAGSAGFQEEGTPQLVVWLRTGRNNDDLVYDCGSGEGFDGECEALPEEPVQVGGNEGVLIGTGTVVVYLDEDVSLVVTARDEFSLSREDLLRLAAGAHPTEHARPAA